MAQLAQLEPADDGARKYVIAAQQRNAKEHPSSDTGSWPVLFEARQFAEAKNFARAEESLAKLLEKEPRNIDALLMLGKTYKKWAAFVLQKMIEIDPDSYRVRQLQGAEHEEKAEYDQALESYQAALAKQADLAGIRYSIGNVYWKMRQYPAAEQWLSEELKRNPHHGLAHYRLGSLYTETGKGSEAISSLQEALQSHPELTEAHFDLGRALMMKGRYTEAIRELQTVAAHDPENDRVHYLLSNAYRQNGRNSEADSELRKYKELSLKRLDRVQREVRDVTRTLESKP
jgi:tetratricopeptide (TPR) repeat protein